MQNYAFVSRWMYLLILCFLIGSVVSDQPMYGQRGGGLGKGKGKGFEHAKKQKERIKNNRIKKEDEEDELGTKKSSKSYDTRGNKTRETTYHPDGSIERTVDYVYDLDEDLTEAVVYDSTNTEVSRNKFEYDNGKRLGKSITRGQDGNVALTTDFSYDNNDNITDVHGKDSEGKTIRRGLHTYNAAGKIMETKVYSANDSLETTVTYATDDSGNVTEQITKDANGNKLQRATFEYDSQGNIIRLMTFDENDSLTSETINEFDNKGRIKKTRGKMPALDMENVIETDYDNEDNPVEQRTYNKNGELVEKKKYKYEKHP